MNPLLHSGLVKIARAYRVDLIYAFGSRAEEVASLLSGLPTHPEHPHSDADIGVQPEREHRLTARERVRLTLDLERELGIGPVDLVILPEANAFLAAEVVRGELLHARDLDEEAETQLYYLRRAGDLAPFFREQWLDTVGSEL
ncbi:MAG: nucleotidyltransferase domain-containing protein [Thermoleophilia bacterium]|nr:nucleotidyltransferase domain-containing protein [Thermoleophilia bacterium]